MTSLTRSMFRISFFGLLAVMIAGFVTSRAHAGDRGDYKSYAREMSDGKWRNKDDRGQNRVCKDVDFTAVKQDGDWKLHVKNFSAKVEHAFLPNCDESGDHVISCVKIETNTSDNGERNCRLQYLLYSRAAGSLTLQTAILKDIKDTKRGGILGFGKRKEYTCDDAYADAKGKFDSVEEAVRCYRD